jgi:hypothetical protein
MSIKQLRLGSSELSKMKDLTGKKINIVLRNNTALPVTLISLQNNEATMLNMRLKKLTVKLADIYEVYFDITV